MDYSFSYHAQSSRRGRRRLIAATVLVVVLVLADIITGGGVRAAARNFAVSVDAGFASVISVLTDNGYFKSHAALAAQNQALTAQLAEYAEKAALYDSLQSANQKLSAMVHLAQTQTGVTAPIDSSFIASPYGTFLVGAGSAQNVAMGDLVLTDQDVVIGKVTSISAQASTVTLIFAPGASVDVTIDGAPVAASGQGGGEGKAEVPQGITINATDPVLAPGYGSRVVGVVGHVVTDPSSAYADVSIGLPVNLSSLEYVYIVKP